MRNLLLLATATSLAACGGGTGVQTVGSTAPPTSGSPTPTPVASFVNPTEAKTYTGLGGVQHYEYSTRSDRDVQSPQLYAADANTVRDSGISITYDPRDAIFDITISRPKGLVSVTGARFQDPVHRTDFGGARTPQAGVPNLAAAKQIQYLQAGGSTGNVRNPASPGYPAGSDYPVGDQAYTSEVTTFFYQKPGTTTKYVTYAGFVRNTLTTTQQTDPGSTTPHLSNTYSLDRAAFVFGEQTANGAVPRSGSGTYTGDMLATVVFNPNLDTDAGTGSYLQWIDGTQTTRVDFGTLAVTTEMNGKLLAPTRDAYSDYGSGLAAGTDFHANATSTIDLAGRGGFTGSFNAACFATACTTGNSLTIAGSSIDGAFYGPNADEIGAGFRIVGGTPDERIDILGTLTGRK